jgi:hypothetical protein
MNATLRNSIRIAALGLATGWFGRPAPAQTTPPVTDLFEKLQTLKTADQAREQLRKLAKADPTAREYLVVHLPPMIEEGPNSRWATWQNAVQLTGELKIVEAAPALAKWLGLYTGNGHMSLSGDAKLEYNLPGKALVQIGDPAVPAVRETLAHGNTRERTRAVYVLFQIGSPAALAALREHLADEPSENLRALIQHGLSKD